MDWMLSMTSCARGDGGVCEPPREGDPGLEDSLDEFEELDAVTMGIGGGGISSLSSSSSMS